METAHDTKIDIWLETIRAMVAGGIDDKLAAGALTDLLAYIDRLHFTLGFYEYTFSHNTETEASFAREAKNWREKYTECRKEILAIKRDKMT